MKELQADVVVVSAGTAGMAAAVTAAEGGASVIAIEKSAATGGTGKMANGIFAVESRLQLLKQLTLSREEAFKIYMDYTHWRVNARLVKAFIDKSADTIDWLEGMGVEFIDVRCHNPGFNYTWHIMKSPKPGQPNGASVMKALADRAGELGISILLKTTVKRLLKENNRITGIIAEDASGEEIRVNSAAVILATGGYFFRSMPGQPVPGGDGIRMAREAGAAVRDITLEENFARPERPPKMYESINNTFMQPGLAVNLLGERFMNEEVDAFTFFGRNAIARQKNGTCFNIIDEDTKQHFVEKGWDWIPLAMPSTTLTKPVNFDDEIKEVLESGDGNIFVADSIEELAGKAGIDPARLRNTIEEYNKACETGRDEIFNKKARYLRPVKRPRFYANKQVSNSIQEWGGIRINHKTEVLTGEYDVIPGLFATGMDAACEIYESTYPFVLPATAMGFAINSGRIAGENASALVENK